MPRGAALPATAALFVLAAALTAAAPTPASQPPAGKGANAQDPAFVRDREVFHFLLENRDKIERKIRDLADGVETVTRSDDPEIAAKIREHVAAMHGRIENRRPIHRRDPLFDAVFRNAAKIRFVEESVPGGVLVRETSDDPAVVALVRAHARVVSRFLENGFDEVRRNHDVPPVETWKPLDYATIDDNPDTREAHLRGLAAREAMAGRLLDRLTTIVAEKGHVAAIEVCRDQAPEIARVVADEHDVRIGRVSFKKRNPANNAPHWAAAAVEARTEDPLAFASDRGTLALLLPIRLNAQCVACHGTPDQVAEPVRDAIAKFYPEDRATGFQPGDLRGWFWVEVPPAAAEADGKAKADSNPNANANPR